jgi:hypothetical protein
MEIMIAFASIVSDDVVAIDDFVKCIPFQPHFLYKVYVQTLGLHGGNKVFLMCIVVWFMDQWFAIGITGSLA